MLLLHEASLVLVISRGQNGLKTAIPKFHVRNWSLIAFHEEAPSMICEVVWFCQEKKQGRCLKGVVVAALQVKDVMKNIMSDLQQTNSEKILLSWVRQSTRPYSQVNVLNFTTSWADGLAFNAVIHRHK